MTATATVVRATSESPPPSDVPTGDRAPLAGLLVALPAAVLVAIAILRWAHGHAGGDFTLFDQGLWKAGHGQNPLVTPFGETVLEDHFGPGVFVFAPLYWIVATPIWLLVAQGVAAWAAVWQICRRLLPRLGWQRSAAVGTALMLSPPVAYALLADVHHVVFAVPFALAAAFAIADGREWRGLAFGLAAALFRPDAAYGILAAYAFLPGPARRRLRPALLLFAYLAFATYMENHLGHPDTHWSAYYGLLGSSPADALSHPLRMLGALVSMDALLKILPWAATGGFLCLLRPRLMAPALGTGLVTVLARWPGTFVWGFHYGIAPALLLAVAWVPVLERRPDLWRFVIGGIVAISVLGGPFNPAPPILTGALPVSTDLQTDHDALCIIRGIPADAGLSAPGNLDALLAHRDRVYFWPYPFAGLGPSIPSPFLHHPEPSLTPGVDYVILQTGGRVMDVPEGFVPDGATASYQRYRRAATTRPDTPVCARAGATELSVSGR